jgi:hypothetical protein
MSLDNSTLLHTLGLKESEQETFGRCLNRLLGETFILREYDREDYYFIQRHREVISAYLNLAQWDLVQDPLGQIFQAINRQESNRRNLKRLETELLLLFCICYLEQRSELSLAKLPSLTIADIYPRYQSLFGDINRLSRTRLREALNTLRRFRLITTPDSRQLTPRNPEQRFLLLPTLLMVLDMDKLDDIRQLLQTYTQPDEEIEDDEAEQDE